MANKFATVTSSNSYALPEDISGRFLDFDPGDISTVWQDSEGNTQGADGQPVGALDCRVSGMRLSQASGSNQMTYESENGGRIVTGVSGAKYLAAASLPAFLPSKLVAPLTTVWWVKPEEVPAAGAPLYHWEIYNAAESTAHINAQYNDPNDASGHKRFTVVRRRDDTTGTTSLAVRVDDGFYPSAGIGTWTMLAFVHKGDPLQLRMLLFKDGGKIIGSNAAAAAALYDGLTTNAGFYLGTRNSTGNYARAGFRRWVAYERALTPAELNKLWVNTYEAWGLDSLA